MVDTGVRPFDVTNARAPDLSASLEDRPVGGLGLHISKELLDSVTYEYGKGQSTITFVKTLET
jgi:anti-sigma regulatory factor (Ser/Thr protein kinase)